MNDQAALNAIYQFLASADVSKYRDLVNAARVSGDYAPETYGAKESQTSHSHEAIRNRLNLCEAALEEIDIQLTKRAIEFGNTRKKTLLRLAALSHAIVAVSVAALIAAFFDVSPLVFLAIILVFLSSCGLFLLVNSPKHYGFFPKDSTRECKDLRTRAHIALAALMSVDQSNKLSDYDIEDEILEIESIIGQLQKI